MDDSRNHCCCGCCHVMTGTKVLGWIEAVFLALYAIAVILSIWGGNFNAATFIIELLLTVLYALCVGLLLYGVSKRTARYLAPHLLLQLIYLVIAVIVGILLLIALITGSAALVEWTGIPTPANFREAEQSGYSVRGAAAIGLAFSVLYVLIELYLWYVVYHCYQFLKRENEFGPLVDPERQREGGAKQPGGIAGM